MLALDWNGTMLRLGKDIDVIVLNCNKLFLKPCASLAFERVFYFMIAMENSGWPSTLHSICSKTKVVEAVKYDTVSLASQKEKKKNALWSG